jgi:molecular chaperone DnaJ
MKLSEAYTVLNLSPKATPEEAKKQYKKLAREFHPDVNKDAGAEAKFKKINEAYQVIESGEEDIVPPTNAWRGSNIWSSFVRDPFSGGRRQYYGGNIDVNITLSFKESAQGAKKELKYSRQVKCPHCHGSGDNPINNGCKTCKGLGQVASHRQNSILMSTCPDCRGRSKTQPCDDCGQNGVLDSEASVTVSIPSAVTNNSVLRLGGMGNFNGSLMGLQDTYTDVYVHINVDADPDMRLEGTDVVSDVRVSLLDALQGCDRKVKTIDGVKKISIVPGAKNKDEVVLSVGDHSNVKHRVVVNVEYPEDIVKLIDVLKEGK